MRKTVGAVLECKKCGYYSQDAIESKKWIKSKIKDKMVICTKCESTKIEIRDLIYEDK